MNFSNAQLHSYLTNRRTISLYRIYTISNILNIPVEYFITENKDFIDSIRQPLLNNYTNNMEVYN